MGAWRETMELQLLSDCTHSRSGILSPMPRTLEAVSERCTAIVAAHGSDEDCQAYISASRHASSVIARPRLKHGRRQAFLSHLNLPTLFFVLSPALLPPLQNSQLFLSQGVGFDLRRLLETPLFCLPVKGSA